MLRSPRSRMTPNHGPGPGVGIHIQCQDPYLQGSRYPGEMITSSNYGHGYGGSWIAHNPEYSPLLHGVSRLAIHTRDAPRDIPLEPPQAHAAPTQGERETTRGERPRARDAVLVLRGPGSRGLRQPQRAPPAALPQNLPAMGDTQKDHPVRGGGRGRRSRATRGGAGRPELLISGSDTAVAA
ncbi:hypothetical protein NPX13_g1811 [Xylaria arbuscula]|uniref:Uncharacterized protein n=1 Tax=Xylaria arbuscula TaxID=114810 RepID=A0A9W8NKE1_9PEZI|nr:hypothetical protein NPX13_g1811 [Xylaria arbuscula]